MNRKNDWLPALMRDYAARMDREIEAEDRRWRARVPESLDRRIGALAAGLAPDAPKAKAAVGKAAKAAGKAVGIKALAIAVAASAAFGAGAYTMSPAVREAVNGAFCTRSSSTASRPPGAWFIPSPGEEYTVREQIAAETMAYAWFEAEDSAVLVEITPRLPDGVSVPADAETVLVGLTQGLYYEQDAAGYLILNDNGTTILISLKNGDRQALFAYAALLARENGLQ